MNMLESWLTLIDLSATWTGASCPAGCLTNTLVLVHRGAELPAPAAHHVQGLLDWVAEHGGPEQFGAFFEHAATCKLGLRAAVDVALVVGPAKGWWAELQPGLVTAFGKDCSTSVLAVLQQLQRVRHASGVDGGTVAARAAAGNGAAPGSADAVQRYMQLAAAVVGTLEPSQPARYGMPSTPARTADFVRDLLLAAYVPGCSGERGFCEPTSVGLLHATTHPRRPLCSWTGHAARMVHCGWVQYSIEVAHSLSYHTRAHASLSCRGGPVVCPCGRACLQQPAALPC